MLPLIYYFAPIIILAGGAVVFRRFRSKRTVIFGLVFFISTIAVNLPFSDVGHATIIADRFTYIPYIGLFIIIGELVEGLIKNERRHRLILSLLLSLVIILLSFQTWQRCKIWKNSGTLWSDVISKYPDAVPAYYNRGNFFLKTQQFDRAIKDYKIAVSLDPRHTRAFSNLGKAYFFNAQYDQEFTSLYAAVNIAPSFRKNFVDMYLNRIKFDARENNIDQLLANCKRALVLSPNNPEVLAIQAQHLQNKQKPDYDQ